MKQDGERNKREENHMLSQSCDVSQKEAMTLHNLWITDMGQWYFELSYFTARWLGFATRQLMPENAMNLSKQFVYAQQLI